LLDHAGELVSRDELCHKVWPPDTFVDFEQGLGTAIKKLRQSLGDDADAPRYIETLPKRGYRFIGAVEKSAGRSEVKPDQVSGAAPQLGPKASIPDPQEQIDVAPQVPVAAVERTLLPLSRRLRALLSAAAGVILALASLIALNVAGWRSQILGGRAAEISSVAVLPFENLAQASDQEYFVDGMTDELITNLGKIGALRVISRTSVMSYKKTRKPLSQIASELNVDGVIEGSVLRSGERVRITAQLASVWRSLTVAKDFINMSSCDMLTNAP
jgi:TolB-like protein/DNA-binding winged helix-turn-helix (wHTH) protein